MPVLEWPVIRILGILICVVRQIVRKFEERWPCTVETVLSFRVSPAIYETTHQKGTPSRYFEMVKAFEKAVGANWSASTSAIMCIAEGCFKILPTCSEDL